MSIVPWNKFIETCFKLVLQPAARVLRTVCGQILKKWCGTRTLHARRTHVARASHARHTHGFLPVDCPYAPVCARQEKMCMHVFFCCGRSTIIESQAVRRKHAGSRTCPVLKRLEGYVLYGAAAISKFGCNTSFNSKNALMLEC